MRKDKISENFDFFFFVNVHNWSNFLSCIYELLIILYDVYLLCNLDSFLQWLLIFYFLKGWYSAKLKFPLSLIVCIYECNQCAWLQFFWTEQLTSDSFLPQNLTIMSLTAMKSYVFVTTVLICYFHNLVLIFLTSDASIALMSSIIFLVDLSFILIW